MSNYTVTCVIVYHNDNNNNNHEKNNNSNDNSDSNNNSSKNKTNNIHAGVTQKPSLLETYLNTERKSCLSHESAPFNRVIQKAL